MLNNIQKLLVLICVLILPLATDIAIAHPAQAAFPGENGILTYRKANGSGPEIRSVTASGANMNTLIYGTNDEGLVSPSWSPDGSQLAYITAASSLLKVVNSDGSGARTVASGITGPQEVTWSNDGLHLAITDHIDGLTIVNIDGTGAHKILNGYDIASPKWSPSGNFIAFGSWQFNGPNGSDLENIMIAKPDGTAVQYITSNDWGGVDSEPDWAPDGSGLVFAFGGQLYVVGLDGSAPIAITGDSTHNFSNPIWAPDGQYIAMLSDDTNPGYVPEIKMLDVSNLSISSVASLPETAAAEVYSNLDWRPISSSIVYRLANWKTHERLFTLNPVEALSAPKIDSGWVYEGIGFRAASASDAGSTPVYRLANWVTKERLFTISAAERDYALAHYQGWVSEGTAFYAMPCNTGTPPVYRMANWKTKERLFTTDHNEVTYALAHYDGWVDEGVAFCAPIQ